MIEGAFRRIYTTSEISVRAFESELGCNQNKWIDVLCLHWSESVSESFVSDVRVQSRARHYMHWCSDFLRGCSKFIWGCAMSMFKAACSHGRYCRLPKWPGPRMTSDPSLGCSVNKPLSGTRTRTWAQMLGQGKCKCALTLGTITTGNGLQRNQYMFTLGTIWHDIAGHHNDAPPAMRMAPAPILSCHFGDIGPNPITKPEEVCWYFSNCYMSWWHRATVACNNPPGHTFELPKEPNNYLTRRREKWTTVTKLSFLSIFSVKRNNNSLNSHTSKNIVFSSDYHLLLVAALRWWL